MPLREFYCRQCQSYVEIYHPSTDPELVPAPPCGCATGGMELLISRPVVDTSSSFKLKPFSYKGLDQKEWAINNLHDIRKVESHYQKTGHDVRFDAYSAEPNNPNDVDGYGAPYRPPDGAPRTKAFSK